MKEQIIDSKIENIKIDKKSGGRQLAIKALNILMFITQTSYGNSIEDFIEDFNYFGNKIIKARPNIASIQNLVGTILFEVNRKRYESLNSLKGSIVSKIDEINSDYELNLQSIFDYTLDMIKDSKNIITCSYSSTISKILIKSKQNGIDFVIMIAESKSIDSSISYGKQMVQELKPFEIALEIFPDNAIRDYIKRTNCAIVGADSILADGSVINGTPTFKVALASKENDIPFYTVCDSTKFNISSLKGQKIKLEDGFDLVPSNHITGIITEKGIFKPDEIIEQFKDIEKYLDFIV